MECRPFEQHIPCGRTSTALELLLELHVVKTAQRIRVPSIPSLKPVRGERRRGIKDVVDSENKLGVIQ